MRFLLLPVLLSAVACTDPDAAKPGDSGADGDTGPVGPPMVDLGGITPRNVVVVHVDTLRADSLPRWGSTRDTMPHLSARGAWVSVQRTVSTAPWTAPATASLLTGEPQHLHNVRFFDDTGPNYLLALPSFATHFQEQGVATALITGSQVLTNDVWDLEQGFDYVRVIHDDPGNAAGIVEDAVSWVDARDTDSAFLLFLQPMDMHGPYRPQEQDRWTWADADGEFFDAEGGEREQQDAIDAALDAAGTEGERAALLTTLRAIYDEQALGLDRALDGLLEELEARGLLDETLVVLTADHGETFYDGVPPHLGHGGTVRHEVVSVPLLFGGAGVTQAHVPCLASNMDVFPTITQAMGLPAMGDTEGRSLLEGCRDHSFTGVYGAAGGVEQLRYLAVESLRAQVIFDCFLDTVVAFDLAADPFALEPRPVAEVPDGEALEEALRGHTREVLTTFPHLVCDVGR